MSDEVVNELKALRRAVTRLEAERDCAAVLARYGYYCDHGRRDEWIKLFTEDGVLDVVMYYGDNVVNADPDKWRHTRFVGHAQLREVIYSPVNLAIEGRSQHRMGGPPSTFRLIDDNNAVVVTYSVVYVKDKGSSSPGVEYVNLGMSRWHFRKIDGQWYIAENIRRKMGSPDTGKLFEDF
jgi:hypothetical protein